MRVSASVNVPVTFGSTILLPLSYADWDAIKRRAVMAHEWSHIRRGDFYVLMLASINTAAFWISPFTWWLNNRLAYLAEARSDAAAIEVIDDRLRYSEILLDLGSKAGRSTTRLAMARPETVCRRVEHILAETILPSKMGWKSWSTIVACVVPLAAITAGAVAQAPSQNEENKAMTLDPDKIAQRLEEQAKPREEIQIDPKILENYVGYYQLGQHAIFTITRQGNDLFSQLTGQRSLQIYPESTQKFFAKEVKAQIFLHHQYAGPSDGIGSASEWL